MFHPDLRLLRSFAAVASEASVTRAAQRLHLTQPTVSGQVKELEQAVGRALFHRTTRSITLTAHGERLLPAALRVLEEVEALRDLVEAMQLAGRSSFRLGAAIYTMDIAEREHLLRAFSEAFPKIDYGIDNRMQSAQIPDLVEGRLDAAVLLGLAAPYAADPREADATPIFNETQYPDTLERVILRRQRVSLLVPRDSALADKELLGPSDLRGLQVATINNEHGSAVADPIHAFLIEHGAEVVVPPEGNAIAVGRYSAAHGICGVGLGWFETPPELVSRPVEGLDFFLDFSIVLGADANQAARQFFTFAKRWTRAGEEASMAA